MKKRAERIKKPAADVVKEPATIEEFAQDSAASIKALADDLKAELNKVCPLPHVKIAKTTWPNIFKVQSKSNHKALISDAQALQDSMRHTNGKVTCIIVDEASSSWGYRNIASKMLPDNSFPVLDGKNLVHLLGFNGKKLWPIDYTPTDNEDKTPQDCYEAQCWDELETVLSLASRWMEKIKLGVFVVLAFGVLVVLFLLGAMAMGGA